MVTAQQVKDAVIFADITEVLHHDCAACGEWVRYIIRGERLYFDPSCGCSWTPCLESREWQDAADWINMQTNESVRSELMKRFGITENRMENTQIVIVGDDKEYHGDQVAIRFTGVKPKAVKVNEEKGQAIGLDLTWYVSFCAVHIPDRYAGVSFQKIVQSDHGDLIANVLSPNLITEGDEITLELNTSMSFVVGLIEKGTVQHLQDFWGQLQAGIGPV